MTKKITRARIDFISLCPRGANRMPVVYKDGDGFEIETLTKANEEAGEILAVVYAPGLVDAQGEFASAPVIKDMAHDFARRRGSVDIRHDGKAVDPSKAFVAESFIVAKGDERFLGWKDYAGKPVELTGAWAAVLKVDDPELRAKYRSGEWNGVSMGGVAAREAVKSDEGMIESFLKMIARAVSPAPTPQEIPMTKDELAKAIADGIAAHEVAKAEAEKAAAAKKAAEAPKPEQAPVFKGDPTKAEDLEAFEKESLAWDLRTRLNSADPKARAVALAEAKKALGGSTNSGKGEESAEVKELRAKLAKALGQSGTASGKDTDVKKSDAELAAEAAERMANLANRERGIPVSDKK